MRRALGLMSLGLAAIFALAGCGWEPVSPGTGGGEFPSKPELEAKIVYECPHCVQPEASEEPLTYTFRADVTLPDSERESVLVHNWDFDDGSKDEGERVRHTFAEPGTYRVRLRVITTTGREATDEVRLSVEAPPDPEPQVRTDVKEGDLCIIERSVPEEIAVGDLFTVRVKLTTKRRVWIAQWEDYMWPLEFDLKGNPAWSNPVTDIPMEANRQVVFSYDVQLFQAIDDGAGGVWMSGTLKCTPDVNSDPEILTLRSQLDVVSSAE